VTLRSTSLTATVVLLVAALSACATTTDPRTADRLADDGDGSGHGRVDGAAEVAEPQVALLTIDPEGAVRQLDLLDESIAELGSVPAPAHVATDGRYVFAADGDGVSIVDSGRWTWDHVDHFHYYRAEPRTLGRVAGTGVASVATTNSSTTGGTGLFFPDSGEAVLVDTEALSKGELVERFRVELAPHQGLTVPIGAFALVTQAEGGVPASVAVYDQDGRPVPGAVSECPHAHGAVTTRVGAVIGCDDGALLATLVDGTVHIERIPYPDGTAAPAARSFAGREGRPTVAGLAGDAGIWLLDTRARSWTLLPAPAALVAVTAVDDGAGHVLALAADGRVLVLEGSTGNVVASTEPLVTTAVSTAGGAPTLVADQHRAYLNAPAERRLYEIDFADGARVARTFETPSAPAFFAETGR
jgi:hypothetical protein